MPVAGDKLYDVWNGKLEIVTFIEESIAPGAWAPTWVIQTPGQSRQGRVSIGMYQTSVRAAWEKYLKECREALPSAEAAIAAAIEHRRYVEEEIRKAEDAVYLLGDSSD